MNQRVYFDNAATTPLLPEVIGEITSQLKHSFGNPSSLHREGRGSRTVVEDARKTIANLLNCSIGELFFTSCGTESNNTVIASAIRDLGIKRIITSRLEHPCVLEAIKHYGADVQIDFINLNKIGQTDIDHLRFLLEQSQPTLVSLMHINNEIGTINDIHTIGNLCREYGALYHSDTVQGIGYYTYDLSSLPVDFISASAHKFHGPKGVGFLYVNADVQIKGLLHGGHQERNLRAGTENIAYISGMATALKLAYEQLDERRRHITQLRLHLIKSIADQVPGLRVVNPSSDTNHYKIVNLAAPLSNKTSLAILNLDMAGFAVSGGSACSSGAETTSHVYDALFPDEELKLIRVSFSHFNNLDEVDRFVEKLRSIL